MQETTLLFESLLVKVDIIEDGIDMLIRIESKVIDITMCVARRSITSLGDWG